MTHPGLRRIDIDAEAARLAEDRKRATGGFGGDRGIFDPDAPAGRRWCKSGDHHEWLHMLLGRAKADRDAAYRVIARQGAAMREAGITLPDGDS